MCSSCVTMFLYLACCLSVLNRQALDASPLLAFLAASRHTAPHGCVCYFHIHWEHVPCLTFGPTTQPAFDSLWQLCFTANDYQELSLRDTCMILFT